MSAARTIGIVILTWALSVTTTFGIIQYVPELVPMKTVDPKIVHEYAVAYNRITLPPYNPQIEEDWSDMEGMLLSLFIYENSTLIILFNAQAEPAGTPQNYQLLVQIRALVDDTPATPRIIVINTITSWEAAPLIFQLPSIGRGAHTVKIQWKPQGYATAIVEDRILDVVAISNEK